LGPVMRLLWEGLSPRTRARPLGCIWKPPGSPGSRRLFRLRVTAVSNASGSGGTKPRPMGRKTGEAVGGGGCSRSSPSQAACQSAGGGTSHFRSARLWQGFRLSPSSPGKTVVYLPANTTAINISATYTPSLWFGMRVERSVMDPTAASRLCARLMVRGQAACPFILPHSGTPKAWGGGDVYGWRVPRTCVSGWVSDFPPSISKGGVRQLTAFPSVTWIPADDPADEAGHRSRTTEGLGATPPPPPLPPSPGGPPSTTSTPLTATRPGTHPYRSDPLCLGVRGGGKALS